MEKAETQFASPYNASLVPPIPTLLLLLALILFSMLIGFLMIWGFGSLMGMEPGNFASLLSDNSGAKERNFVRTSLLLNHLTMFVIPAIGLAWWLHRRYWKKYLSLDKVPLFEQVIMGSLFMMVAMPLAQLAFRLNRALPLPEWAITMEENTGSMVQNLLVTNSPIELIFNILVIACIPALGEELVFRGFVQKNLARQFNRPILAIWLAAFIFSLFHLQFEGFLPRLLLGALLGYLYYWTDNLWVPIIGHLFNNGIQILAQYFMADTFKNIDIETAAQQSIPIPIIIMSFLFVAGIGYYFHQQKEQRPKLA